MHWKDTTAKNYFNPFAVLMGFILTCCSHFLQVLHNLLTFLHNHFSGYSLHNLPLSIYKEVSDTCNMSYSEENFLWPLAISGMTMLKGCCLCLFMQDLYNLYFITLGITKASRLTFPGLTWYNFPFNKDYLVTTAWQAKVIKWLHHSISQISLSPLKQLQKLWKEKPISFHALDLVSLTDGAISGDWWANLKTVNKTSSVLKYEFFFSKDPY